MNRLPGDEEFPRREIERAGYGAIWRGQKSWNGVAILARDQDPRGTVAYFPAIPTTVTAATSRRRSMASSGAVSVFQWQSRAQPEV